MKIHSYHNPFNSTQKKEMTIHHQKYQKLVVSIQSQGSLVPQLNKLRGHNVNNYS